MTTTRWKFRDVETDEEWTLPQNPLRMSSPPLFAKALSTSVGLRPGTVHTSSPPGDWEFSGPGRTREHHDTLLYWQRKPGKVVITDHMGREYEVIFKSFRPEDRPSTRQHPFRFQYTMKAQMLRRLA